jgi:hypothetical protein
MSGYTAILIGTLFGVLLCVVGAVFTGVQARQPVAVVASLVPLATAVPLLVELCAVIHYAQTSGLARAVLVAVPFGVVLATWCMRRAERRLLFAFVAFEALAGALGTAHLVFYLGAP